MLGNSKKTEKNTIPNRVELCSYFSCLLARAWQKKKKTAFENNLFHLEKFQLKPGVSRLDLWNSYVYRMLILSFFSLSYTEIASVHNSLNHCGQRGGRNTPSTRAANTSFYFHQGMKAIIRIHCRKYEPSLLGGQDLKQTVYYAVFAKMNVTCSFLW